MPPLALPLSCHFPFPHVHFLLSLSPLAATLMRSPVSVATKELTGSLSPLDSALTKNMGGGGVMVNQLPSTERRARQDSSRAGPPFRPRRQSVSTPVRKLALCTDGSVAIGG